MHSELSGFVDQTFTEPILSPSSAAARSPTRDTVTISCKVVDAPAYFELNTHGSIHSELKRGETHAPLSFRSSVAGSYTIELTPPRAKSPYTVKLHIAHFLLSAERTVLKPTKGIVRPHLWTDVAVIWMRNPSSITLSPPISLLENALKVETPSALERETARPDWYFRKPDSTDTATYSSTDLGAPSLILSVRVAPEATALGSHTVSYSVIFESKHLGAGSFKVKTAETPILASFVDLDASQPAGKVSKLCIPLSAVPHTSWVRNSLLPF